MQHKATKLQKINKNKFEHIYKLTLKKQKKMDRQELIF